MRRDKIFSLQIFSAKYIFSTMLDLPAKMQHLATKLALGFTWDFN